MKTIIKITLISLFAFACSGNNLIEPGELESPLLMHVFCQASPNDTLMRFEYEYNNDLLISETKFTLGELQNKVTYQYNSNNQITSELSEWKHRTVEKTYHYNAGQLEKIIYKTRNFDENGQLTSEEESEATFEYENDLVIKKWENWGGFITYEYKDDKLVKKIDHTENGEEHHITTYQYKGDSLTEEIKKTVGGNLIYHKIFHYDSRGRLDFVEDQGNTIEENRYDETKLIEKRENYFGIDPCFSPCCGDFIYRYEY